MKVYFYGKETNEYLFEGKAQKSPLEKNKFLVPKRATQEKPPKMGENESAVFDESKGHWVVVPDFREEVYYDDKGNEYTIEKLGEVIPEWGLPEPPMTEQEMTPERIDQLRLLAYQKESDPLYFKWQRQEATKKEWLDKVQEIKERYPDNV